MHYYFPGPIDITKLPRNKRLLTYSVNSGENAIRLLLQSFKLGNKAKVAVPLFVCDSLKTAIIKEELVPFYLDIKENNYWTNYDIAVLKKNRVHAVILVHLYGFIHPDTKSVTEFCKQNNIPLIHDMAQCYGADESALSYGSIVYSFGPGKSTTAAGGGLIKEMDELFFTSHIKNPSVWNSIKAKQFMRSRRYGYDLSSADRMIKRITSSIDTNKEITAMSSIQKDAAGYVMDNITAIVAKRKERYLELTGTLNKNPELAIAYDDDKGLYFKCVINVKGDVTRFKEYLTHNNIPYFSLFDSITVGLNDTADKPRFILNAQRFIEISTEATIPLTEIKRVGEVLLKFN